MIQCLRMSWLEIIAVALGIINVALIIGRSIWNYLFGLLMVVLYAKIFFDAQLYSDTLLQVFFFVVQIYGLFDWLNAREANGKVIVRHLQTRGRLLTFLAVLVMWFALGFAMQRWTDAAYPYWDAAIAAGSVAAQTLLARRFIENWLLWIAVDLGAIALFMVKDLQLTAGLYGLFLCMAIGGVLAWGRQLHRNRLPAGAVP